MKRRVRHLSALVAGTLAFVVGTSTAHALDKAQIACQEAIGKEGLKYAAGLLKLNQKCNDANLKAALACGAPDPAAVMKLETKLAAGLDKKCTFTVPAANLTLIGFPGPCLDPTPLTLFDLADLKQCIKESHENIVNALLAVEYDDGLGSPLAVGLSCQKEIAKNGAKVLSSVVKAVQKCRNGINKGKILGLPPSKCQASEPKTVAAIDKTVKKAVSKIRGKCDDATVDALDVCEPDQTVVGGSCTGGTNAGEPCLELADCPDTTGGTACTSGAAPCEVQAHLDASDNASLAHVATLIDFEYATPAACGDGVINQANEECDGADDGACDGFCGAPGLFGCLCTNIPRERVVEHANADLDNGWSGKSHDSGIVEGGGYVTELYCDDTNLAPDVCRVGPTCSLLPHSSCSPTFDPLGGPPYTTGDGICAGLGQGTCRRTKAGTTAPHCEIDFDQECLNNAQCPGFKDRCVKVSHGPPLPLSAAGISVCVENIFSEDVVGTTNLVTGEGSIRLRQQSITHLGPAINQPCPVCGGFCSGALGAGDTPGARSACSDDSDCPGSFCVQDNICSWGPNHDKVCRTDPPFGGPTAYFGVPSVDCPPNVTDIGKLDILFNPATTGQVTLTASVACNAAGFTGKVCFQGSNDGRDCTLPADCPGGSCNNQCFCPNNTTAQKPNACLPACKGGAFDAQPCTDDSECHVKACFGGGNNGAVCTVDSECPGGTCSKICAGGGNNGAVCTVDSECPGGTCSTGFCREADCRHNVSDTASVQEGRCTTGPALGSCSVTAFKGCEVDADCAAPFCPFCETLACQGGSNNGAKCTTASECPAGFCLPETCILNNQQCFVNGQIIRQGSPGVPDRVSAAIFCIPLSGDFAVNATAGLPGPGAITQPATTLEVGL